VHAPDAPDDQPFGPDLTLNRAGLPGRLNEPDEHAVEQARRIACRRLDVQVTALTMGRPGPRAGCAGADPGADQGVHVLDDALHGSDALATSRVLAAAVRRLGFDLVLCGAASADSGTACALHGRRTARVPSLCFADALWIGRRRCGERADRRAQTRWWYAATADRRGGGRRRASGGRLGHDRCAAPRYPTIHAIAEARHKLCAPGRWRSSAFPAPRWV